MNVLGLMSGTSADGIDAVLVKFTGNCRHPKWKLINHISKDYPKELKERILKVSQGMKLSSSEWLDFSEDITNEHANVALECDPNQSSDLVGCHGQTVWHRPPTEGKLGGSLQVIQGPFLARLLNRKVIYDFRSLDLALGGQGAPLVPLVDEALIGRANNWQAILNLGGIANLTFIPPISGPESMAKVFGWDCGPANTLIDFAVQNITDGFMSFDKDGLIASSGKPDEDIIKKWLKEDFFHILPPKSTGREQFGLIDLQDRLKDMAYLCHSDQIATLSAFTASIIAQDLNNLYLRESIRPVKLIISGGGSQNKFVIQQLISRCKGMIISNIEEIGIPYSAREALSFALLAWWNVNKYQSDLPLITGAFQSTVLGISASI